MKIDDKKFVSLSYTLNVNGEVADEATAERPLEFVFGMGYLLPEFEKNIRGLEPGDTFEFTLTPEVGYGPVNEQMIIEVPKEAFMVNGQIEEGLLQEGSQIPMMTSDGHHIVGRVVGVNGDAVKMDFNHPMAGHTLDFKGKIISVRDAVESDFPQTVGCGCEHDGCGDDCSCGCGQEQEDSEKFHKNCGCGDL